MDKLNEIFQLQQSYFKKRNTKSVVFRLQKLKELKQVLISNEERIYDALKKDLNKPIHEAFLGEFMGMLHELNTSISKLRRWSRKKRTKSPLLVFPSKAAILPEPYGQVLIVSPWNYPIDLCLSPFIGAIAAGNTVILKPSEFTPHTGELIKELLTEVFPKEYVNVQLGGIELSKNLLKIPFDYIFFTGSISVGKEVMKAASANLTPVTLELGGKCPVILSKSYSVKKAAKSIAWGKFFNAGQSCVAPDYVLLPENKTDEFITCFKQFTQEFTQNHVSDYTRIINQQHFNRLINYLKQGEVLYGGEYSKDTLQIFPTLIKPDSFDSPLMQDEIFGPILPVISYKTESEILEIINSRQKALVVYIFSSNKKEMKFYWQQTSSGNVCINDALLNYVNKNLPFGGVGHSGMGKYHGKASFETFSNYKSIHQKLSPDLPFRYPPYNGQHNILRSFKNILNKNI